MQQILLSIWLVLTEYLTKIHFNNDNLWYILRETKKHVYPYMHIKAKNEKYIYPKIISK